MNISLQKSKVFMFFIFAMAILIAFLAVELIIIKYRGEPVPAPSIPREITSFGTGSELNFLVLGDSTSVGQGSSYENSVAYKTAHYLSEQNKVNLLNLGVSGTEIGEVSSSQLPNLDKFQPDIALISAGANDVTHLSSLSKIRDGLNDSIDLLIKNNCNIKIIVTGSPAMGTIPRFPQPIRSIAGFRTNQVNQIFIETAKTRNLTFAPIAEKTREQFAQDPSLFAKDLFHPNARGYSTWIPVLSDAVDDALQNQPSHCN